MTSQNPTWQRVGNSKAKTDDNHVKFSAQSNVISTFQNKIYNLNISNILTSKFVVRAEVPFKWTICIGLDYSHSKKKYFAPIIVKAQDNRH